MTERDIERYSKDYSKRSFEDIQVKYRRKKVLEILNKYNPKNILEIGCGLEPIIDYYNNFDKCTIVEPSEEFCSIANNSKNFNPDKITIIKNFLENSLDDLVGMDFDFILCSSLLHEVINPDLLLKSIKKLCTKDTIVHINVPNTKSLHIIWAYTSKILDSIDDFTPRAIEFQHSTTFDMEKLTRFAEGNDFQIIEKGSFFVKPFNHAKMEKCLEYGILDENLLDGLYDLIGYFEANSNNDNDLASMLGSEIFVNCKIK